MKKIILFLLWFFLFLSFFNVVWAACTYDDAWFVWDNLNNCLSWSKLVEVTDASVSWWFKDKIISWVKTIGGVLSLFAVWWIVYGSFQLVISSGSDETVSKWKNIIKWSILWFLALLSAGSVIAIVVNIMYTLG